MSARPNTVRDLIALLHGGVDDVDADCNRNPLYVEGYRAALDDEPINAAVPFMPEAWRRGWFSARLHHQQLERALPKIV